MHQEWKEKSIVKKEYLNLKIYAHKLACMFIHKKPMGKDTSLEIYEFKLVCLSIPNKPMDSQSYTYSLVVWLNNILLLFFEHKIPTLKLFDICSRWIFDLEGKPSNPLIIEDLFLFEFQISF